MTGLLPSLESIRTSFDAAKRGCPDALRNLLCACTEPLLARVHVMMGPRARAAAETGDFVQDTLLAALRSLETFQFSTSEAFLCWLVRIARNRITDQVRRVHEQAFASFASTLTPSGSTGRDLPPSEIVVRQEDLDRLATALLTLAPDRQRVVELRHFDNLSFGEIGRILDRSENAVQLLHSRALADLGKALSR